jgi:multiple sugar transport system substrate-binding protein
MKKRFSFTLLIVFFVILMLGSIVSAKTELTIWMHENAAFVDGLETTIEKYEAQNPNLTIKLQRFPYDAFIQKLKTAFVAGTSPDMVQMFGTWVPEYSRNGFLHPAPEGIIDRDDFFDAALGAYLLDGELYGVPQEFNLENGGVLAYPDKFKAAEIPYPPQTYNELVEAAKELVVYDDNGNLLVRGFDFISTDNIMFTFLSFILQQDASYWADDGVHFNFTSAEAVKAMIEMKNLVVKYHVTDFSQIEKSLGDMDSSGIFFSGGSVMTYRGSWTIPTGFETYNPSLPCKSTLSLSKQEPLKTTQFIGTTFYYITY